VQAQGSAAERHDVVAHRGIAARDGARGGLGARFVNAQVVYSQALLASSLVTYTTKVLVRRPRPFSYSGARCAFLLDGSERYLSFFSGHASLSFAAAVAGSFLTSARVDAETGAAVWGAELALAGVTAHLRARAGKHYYSDILAGALVGAGVGLAVPALNGAAEPPRGSDWLAALAGLIVGVAGSQPLSLGGEATTEGVLSLALSPLSVPGAHGLAASGSW
jgi:membrane-associated phospholipid phosphatase